MGTKKFLSVLLAMMLAVSVFSMVSASAVGEEDTTEAAETAIAFVETAGAAEEAMEPITEPTTEAATAEETTEPTTEGELAVEPRAVVVVVPQAAGQGFPTTSNLNDAIKMNSTLAGRWDYAVLEWEVFARSTVAPAASDGYYDLKNKATPEASVTWTVTAFGKDADGKEDRTKPYYPEISSNGATAATKAIAIYTDSTSTYERLFIKQGKSTYYGTLIVEMKLDVTGAGILYGTKTIKLVDQSSFTKLLEEAQKVADKSERYKSDYLDGLKRTINEAKLYYNSDPNASTFDKLISDVKEALQAEIDDAPNHYKLSGWDFLDDLLGDSMGYIWAIVDIFNAIQVVFDPIVSFFSTAIKFFGPIISIFSGLGGLLV